MKRIFIIVFTFVASCLSNENSAFKSGDIIFHTSQSEQSKALQIATKSEFSHMGIIFEEADVFFVYEAVQPVKRTPLDEWINRGLDAKYVVKRLKNAPDVLTPEALRSLKESANKYLGKDYDLNFEWSEKKMYCSELVWKLYISVLEKQVGNLQKLKDLDLEHPVVQTKLKERYGENIPLNEIIITPVAMYNSDLLELIFSNY